jgi:ABC-type multidrug transport system fused ATPase/permease subunit
MLTSHGDEAQSVEFGSHVATNAYARNLRYGSSVIAHRLATIRNVDQVVVLDRGKVLEQGPYAELRDAPDSRFSQLVAAQTL